MGRGRAKAKQTKVARRLKYTTTGTDLDRLRAELSGGSPVDDGSPGDESEDDYEDPYAGYPDEEEDEDEDGGEAPTSGQR